MVNWAWRNVRRNYDPARVTLPALAAEIRHAGYDVATIRFTLSNPDVSCTWCASRLERVLADVVGVIQVTAKPKQREVKVLYVPALTSAVQLVTVVREAGFEAQPKLNDGAGVADWLRRLRFW